MPLDNDLAEAVEDIKTEISEKLKEVKTAQDDLIEKMAAMDEKKASAEDITDIKGHVEESRIELEEIGESIIAIQKKLKRTQAGEQSVGRKIAETKDFGERLLAGETIETKDITAGSFSDSTLPGGHRRAHRGLIEPLTQDLHMRDILPTGSTNAAVMEYEQETGFTNNADVVAEGALKPQSELTFVPKSAVMRKIAHFFRVSEERLDDIDAMESYLNQRGLYGLLLKEEDKLVNGAGPVANDIDGLALAGNNTAYNPATVPGTTPTNTMDDIRIAIAQVHEADLYASGVVLNHMDAAALDLTKDADGKYLHPAFAANTAWGLPTVRTKAVLKGKFMVGGFVGNVMVWQKKALEVRRSTEDRDNFVTNRVTILIEERIGQEILRPEGIIYGDLTVT